MAARAQKEGRAGPDQRVATCCLLGVSTRRMDKVGADPRHLRTQQEPGLGDGHSTRHVEQFRTRIVTDAGPFKFVAADALVLKVREGGRVVPVHVLVATGVIGDGHREVLGVQVASSEDGAGWLVFFRDPTARGLAGVKLVTSDAHRGLVSAIEANPARRILATVPHPPSGEPDVGNPEVELGWVPLRRTRRPRPSPSPSPSRRNLPDRGGDRPAHHPGHHGLATTTRVRRHTHPSGL